MIRPFLFQITWKAFWARRRVVILMSLFLGMAMGLVWLSWDTARAGERYLMRIWTAVGMPFYMRSLQADPGRVLGDVLGPVSLDVWREVMTQAPPQGVMAPWIEREISLNGQTVRWVVTDASHIEALRPWIRLESTEGFVWINPMREAATQKWSALCRRWNVCDETPGQWTTGHDPYDVLIDWTWWQRRWGSPTADWIEGRWTGSPEAYRQWKIRVEQTWGLAVVTDHPAAARFRTVVGLTTRFLQLTGGGLTLMAVLTLVQVMVLDALYRRREWSVWVSMGAEPRMLFYHFAALVFYWSVFVFVAANLTYWVGRWALAWIVPDLPIRASPWEGPVVAGFVGILCGLGIMPAIRALLRIQPAAWLRAE